MENTDNFSSSQKGGISVQIEHIFPVIKKWLYSEKEIFLREIVSNACDADTKLNKLISLGEASGIDPNGRKVLIKFNKTLKTISVCDNGIGMTEEELKKYLCQIALSGALDFIEKYESESDSGIIGHFGLGFYSSFMVSDTVDVITRSYNGAPAVKWTCSGDGEYEIVPDFTLAGELIDNFGSTIIMHINEDGEEYLNEAKLRETLLKYCEFMPVEIYLEDEEADKKDDEEIKPINDPHPLWQKAPSECTEDEYKDFYKKLFHDYKDPLFQIHLKADYPLNFKGILYFPKLSNEYESIEGQVKLYYNQVFVADNIKEIIPEYLLMLKGVLDCPDLPLNVSRSYLQNSGYVSKISSHITKKIADKLNSMFTGDRENFEKIWHDIKTFIEYASLKDNKFYERVKNSIIFEKLNGGYTTLEEYLEAAKDKNENKVYYATDKNSQAKYISMYESRGIEVLLLDKVLDTQFAAYLETKNENVKFLRVDSALDASLSKEEAHEIPELKTIFEKIAGDKVKIEFSALEDKAPLIITVSEESRRMNDMMKMYGMDLTTMPDERTLVVNTSSSLNKKLAETLEADPDKAEKLAKYVYSLAKMSQAPLNNEELIEFLDDSYNIIELI